jgi:FAD dependent oxidoreductase
MRSMKLSPLTISFAAFLLLSIPGRAKVVETDVLVFGGTAGGVSAACTAARLGKKVALTEFSKHIGGLTSGGLGATDIGNKAAIGGFSRAFYKDLGKHYGKEESWTFEPHVAEQLLLADLQAAKVPVYLEERLASVKKDGARIVEITMENGDVFRAKTFIDSSYEGDLMAKAGVKYMVGREANARFGETLDGVREKTQGHQFTFDVDPYVKPGDPTSGLLPFIQPEPLGEPGSGDACVQAYNFRLCLTKNPANRIPIAPPPGYDPKRYELLGRLVEARVKAGARTSFGSFIGFTMVTPEKTDNNNSGAFSTDFIGANYAYPDGDYATRDRIWKEHENYTRGFLTFLATDPRVPQNVRDEASSWGLCKDEFPDTGGWPYALYVREARRMLSDYVMTEKNCRHLEKAEDSVALGAYNMDSHNSRRIVQNGFARNEGDVEVGVKPYPVSYRSIVPKATECDNLWVPVCLSATHIAYGSIRMEPVFMILCQSAATAAVIAINDNVTAQNVNHSKLKEQLLKDGQVLEWTAVSAPEAKLEIPKGAIVLDDEAAVKNGEWVSSTASSTYLGEGYIHDGNAHKGALSLTWTPEITKPGEYEIIFVYPPNNNRATNVPVTIEIANSPSQTVTVNEKKREGRQSLGKFSLPAGKKTTITVSNKDTNGYVVVDCLFLLRPE